jgi:addiction module HigA family antidote
MQMHNPPHPGEILREEWLVPLGLTITRAAEGLGVTRKALSQLVNGHTAVSIDMAIRLSKGLGSTPEHWLRLQLQYDLWSARKKAGSLRLRKIKPTSGHERPQPSR